MRCDSATNLKPQGRTLADGCELGRLEVGEAKSRKIAVLLGELGQTVNDDCELVDDKRQCLADEDEVCIAARDASAADHKVVGKGIRTQ